MSWFLHPSGAAKKETAGGSEDLWGDSLRCFSLQASKVSSYTISLDSIYQIKIRLKLIMDSLPQFQQLFYEKEQTDF